MVSFLYSSSSDDEDIIINLLSNKLTEMQL